LHVPVDLKSRIGVPHDHRLWNAERADMTPRFLPAGDSALTIELGDTAEFRLSMRVQALYRRVVENVASGIVEVVPALRSLTVHYDPCLTSAARLRVALLPLVMEVAAGMTDNAEEADEETPPAARTWSIPACYEPEYGPDVEAIALACGLSPWQVTALHACLSYRVLMLGFMPGHPYIGDLPPPLWIPRRETPRTTVPPGSIAIATTMCVIYPVASPGGWHIIGRTPVRLFDPDRAEPSLLAPGDEVRFSPISSAELAELSDAVDRGAWTLEPERSGASA
jgi:inhibitor of KinA